MLVQEGLWKVLLAMALLVLQLSIMGAQADPATMGSTISTEAKKLAKLLSSVEEKIEDLTAAYKVVRGLTFDLFNEEVSSQVMVGILLQDYKTVVDRFVLRFLIPKDVEPSLLDGEFAEESINDFHSAKNKTGLRLEFTYGRFVTVKHDGKIDVAYSVYFLEFELSPIVIEHKKRNEFLRFIIDKTMVWHETQEQSHSEKDWDYMQSYFEKKAIEGFKKQYPGLIQPPNIPYMYCSGEICDRRIFYLCCT